jgi:hypothetical protein
MRFLMVFAFVLGGCSGDEPPAGTPACTKALYDTCATEHDCTTSNCYTFAGDGFQACTQGCSTTMPCPMQGDQVVACDPSGVCKPAMATVCEIQP